MLLPFSIWERTVLFVNCACLSWAYVKFSVCQISSFPFGIEGGMWDVIVLIPDHCLSIYFLLSCCINVSTKPNGHLVPKSRRIDFDDTTSLRRKHVASRLIRRHFPSCARWEYPYSWQQFCKHHL